MCECITSLSELEIRQSEKQPLIMFDKDNHKAG
jgi:hypothetical protein